MVHRRDAFRASKIMADRLLATSNIDVVWNAVVEEVLDPSKGEVTGLRLKNVVSGERFEFEVDAVQVDRVRHERRHEESLARQRLRVQRLW